MIRIERHAEDMGALSADHRELVDVRGWTPSMLAALIEPVVCSWGSLEARAQVAASARMELQL